MKKYCFKLIIGLITVFLITLLIVQLINAPTFMLPSVYLTGILIMAILLGSLIIAGIIKLMIKKVSLFIILCSIISITSITVMFKFYSPSLTIIVPKGYVGQITLVLSHVDKDILKVDSNGIGYVTRCTFDKIYTKPKVYETDGTDVSKQCIGFNPSAFWAITVPGTHRASNYQAGLEIDYKSFEIVPKDKHGQKQNYNVDLNRLVDKTKL